MNRAWLAVPLLLAAAPGLAAQNGTFEGVVLPFIAEHCHGCHNDKLATSGLNLKVYADTRTFLRGREDWDEVLDKLKTGQMPPAPLPRPPAADVERVTAWLSAEFNRQDAALRPDPGRVTARRLNRYEYNLTVRDLLAVDFQPAADFPVDAFAYGFDNNGDVLSVTPTLMEKYLMAARKIARAAIVPEPAPKKPSIEHNTNLAEKLLFVWNRKFEWEGDYEFRFAVPYLVDGRTDPCDVLVSFDGSAPQRFKSPVEFINEGRFSELRLHLAAGTHRITAWLDWDFKGSVEIAWKKEEDRQKRLANLAQGKTPPKGGGGFVDRRPAMKREEVEERVKVTPPYVEFVEVRGPFDPKPAPLPEGYQRVFACGHAPGKHTKECIRTNLAELARRAWRRPVAPAEVAKLTSFVRAALPEEGSIDQAMRVGVEAVLVSPNFLFRIERDTPGTAGATDRRIGDFELASRLSYFLWSSTPDEELYGLAREKKLAQPAVLEAQVRRMLKDPKIDRFVDNFGGQWLQVRNIDNIRPDPDKFPEFKEGLRQAMKEETRTFFANLIREDRSVLEFLTARYTYANELLARYYGIAGVQGEDFRRVDLTGTPRIGVLTQGGVLAVSSYPTRTSPVIRGKWILENILNTPPPPPPADVPPLDEAGVGVKGSLRQQLERHRSNPVCASCHARMDPLGFSLENFDAIGRWRTMDGSFPIDPSGMLPNGKSFASAQEMALALTADGHSFTRSLTEKLMTFALGRSVTRSDRPVTDGIVKKTAAGQYRFSALIQEIVASVAFQRRRAERDEPKEGQTPGRESASSRRLARP